MLTPIHVDEPGGMGVFEAHPDHRRGLRNLERERHIHDARYAGQVAVVQGVTFHPVLVVLLLLCRRPRLVGKWPSLYDTLPCRYPFRRVVVLDVP